MPRIRTIKPEFWADEDLSKCCYQARLLFIGLWNLSDDYGICRSNIKWIKAQLFPYDDNLRTDQIDQWIDQLVKVRALIPFTIGEGYLYVRTFKIHQKIDRPSKNGHISAEKLANHLNIKTPESFEEYSSNIHRLLAIGKERNKEKEEEEDMEAPAGDDIEFSPEEIYKGLEKNKQTVFDFIKNKKPLFIEPYVDLWNFFAKERSLALIAKINDSRKRNFAIRVRETTFDLSAILKKAGTSQFLLTSKWFGFDWIIKNDTNYLKVLEGNYDNGKEKQKEIVSTAPVLSLREQKAKEFFKTL